MAALPPNATQEEVEEELDFTEVLIQSLDSGADDYATRLAEFEERKRELSVRLEIMEQRGSSGSSGDDAVGPSHDSLGAAGLATPYDHPNGSSQALAMNGASETGFPNFSGQLDVPQTGAKRPATQALRFESQHPCKRPTPEPSNVPTPDSSVEDLSSHVKSVYALNERARQRQLAVEAALKRQRESRMADEHYAWQLSNGRPLPGSSASASSSFSAQRPAFQTTLNHTGSYRRAPPTLPTSQHQPKSSHSFSPVSLLPNPFDPQSSRSLPAFNSIQPSSSSSPFVKTEPGATYPTPTTQPTRSTEVVDLTLSESDDTEDDDLREIAANGFTPSDRGQRASGPAADSAAFDTDRALALRTARNAAPSSAPFVPSMPGSFPGANMNGHQSVYGSSQPPDPQQPGWFAQATARLHAHSPAGFLGNQLAELGNLINSNRGRAPWMDDSDDDDLIFSGSRSIRGVTNASFSELDLYSRRYNEMADQNPEKTMEEISALLDNIRPDEELPEHLRVQTPEDMSIRLHKYQELGLTWLKNCEEGSNKGGILADEMGLGKTIQMLGLIVTRKSTDPRCKTTLIVAPVALMRQWKQEIEQKIKPGPRCRLSVFTQHGPSKKKRFADLQMYDIVLTTYDTLASEVKKLEAFRLRQKHDPTARPTPKEQCALLSDEANWYRVILDEAQCIKNKTTRTAQAAAHLNSKYRFCVTGTPMMNNVEEFYALVKFLRINPYCRWDKFRVDIVTPLKSHNDGWRQSAMSKLQALCKALMLRRTKKSTFDGKPILVLPERTTEIENPDFDDDERSFYNAIESKTRLEFNKYLQRGEVGTNYSAVLVLLLRLRQAACHPHLIRDFGIAAAADITEDAVLEFAKQLDPAVVARIKATGGNFECVVCYDVVENPAIYIPCGHDTCRECFSRLTDPSNAIRDGNENGGGARCPNCRAPIDPKKVTDFDAFKKIHMPELLTEEERAELEKQEEHGKADESDDSAIESDDSDDDDDDDADPDEVDAKGNLKDFIVPDDHLTDSETEAEAEAEEVNDVDTDDLDAPPRSRVKGKGKQKAASEGEEKARDKASGKGKGKGKGKKREKRKKKEKKTRNKAVTLADLAKLSRNSMKARKAYLRRLRENYMDSAKIRQTMELLQQIIEAPEREKVLVFSQWTSLLDLLEIPIDGLGWNYRRYDGSMNTKMRADAVDDFRDHHKDVRIMLVSLKAGNAGLNLNMASRVIILDPFWNPYIEEQAIDRAHRIGQERPVTVHRILIKSTVEDRIIELQERKRALISEALDEKAGQNIARLGVQELAYLFGVTRNANERVNYQPRRQG